MVVQRSPKPLAWVRININSYMDYQKIYNSIIERSKNRTTTGYIEKHHIIPKCLGGSDSKDNIVKLYPQEHFICHILLIKIYPNNHKLIYAVNKMCSPTGERTKRKLYGWLKEKFSKVVSENQKGDRNSQYNTIWITDGINIKKINKEQEIPSGWFIGRKIKKQKEKKTRLKISEEIALSLLKDYESGMPMKDILLKYNRKNEQSVTSFLRKRFPNRKKFLPKSRNK